MTFDQLVEQAKDTITVKRVYGDPITSDGVILIPAADVRGGAGGGEGEAPDQGHGSGGGFGVIAKPAGAFVIKDGKVRWQPAVDVNRMMFGMFGMVSAIVIRVALRRARAKRRG